MIIAKKLKKTFRHPETVTVLSGISFDAHPGESVAITGRSGEGKTTLLHILGTLEPFDEGELFIKGSKVTTSNGAMLRSKHIGFVFQSFNLLEDFSTLDNVLMPARIARLPISQERGHELLHLVGMDQRANFPVKHLSGGERQRVAIARALCNDPEILFADEPTGNLDSANSRSIADLLLNLVKEQKKTLILVTHNITLAARCQRHLLLTEGQLVHQPPTHR
jgi:lipoprotein-releasing system ATP-binding protein